MGFFFWLAGDRARALASFRKAADSPSKSSVGCLGAVMVADDLGDAATRDEYAKALITQHRDQAPKTARLWEMFRDALARGPKQTPPVKDVDQVLQSIPEAERGDTQFLVAMYFKNHGKPEDAVRYLAGCVRSPKMSPWARAIAAEALRALDREFGTLRAEHLGPSHPRQRAYRPASDHG